MKGELPRLFLRVCVIVVCHCTYACTIHFLLSCSWSPAACLYLIPPHSCIPPHLCLSFFGASVVHLQAFGTLVSLDPLSKVLTHLRRSRVSGIPVEIGFNGSFVAEGRDSSDGGITSGKRCRRWGRGLSRRKQARPVFQSKGLASIWSKHMYMGSPLLFDSSSLLKYAHAGDVLPGSAVR